VNRAVPLADAAALRGPARRALTLRAVAVGVLAVLLAAVALTTGVVHASARPTSATVVVLDLSGSIGPEASATIVRTLRAVSSQGGRAGLVLFSDATQEAVPPTAPAGTLRAYVRFFARAKAKEAGLTHNPWTDSFSAGTQIGRGLAAARLALRRAGIERGRVILVSDVSDAVLDVPLMRRELLAYARDPNIELRLAAVPSNDASAVALFRRVLGRDALAVGQPPASALVARSSHGFPTTAVALVVAVAFLLAAYEFTNAPLTWREAA
jgi:hypothetical protein